MKIDSSAVGMSSFRSYRETNVTMRRFVISQHTDTEEKDLQADGSGEQTGTENTQKEKESSQPASLKEWQSFMQPAAGRVSLRSSESQTYENIRQRTIRFIFQLLFSHRRERFNRWNQENTYGQSAGGNENGQTEGGEYGRTEGSSSNGQASGGTPGKQLQAVRSSAGVRVLNYSMETIHIEKENTSFSTEGTVKTADGREINFQVNVGMSREFQTCFSEELQLASFRLCDPLVINLDSNVADVEDQTFYFDLDADGEMDEISRLGSGSGYLALDKNGDGVINDGSELFGTKSGDGFADLAKYDEDGNGWIDENDAIWDKLKIWCKDENGKDVLYRLADKGVGAICLQNTATDFTMQGQDGKTQGVIRNTGVFLYENGLAGTIQHVDMAKYDMGA